jgi:predicted HTH domain antitoxin
VRRERVLATGMGYTRYVMCEVRFQIPDASVAALGATPDSVGEKLRLLAAMMAFEHDQLSAGAAAELAGISKIEFLHRLKDFGVDALRQSPQDFDRDLETLRDIG